MKKTNQTYPKHHIKRRINRDYFVANVNNFVEKIILECNIIGLEVSK
jgi:hypothetical protein